MANKGYTIVPVSVKTGKPLIRPKRGQEVKYAVMGPRGGIKLLREEPQKFYKTDLEGLNKSITGTNGKNFVIHEQKTKRIKRVDGKKQYKKDKEGNFKLKQGKKIPIYDTKLSGAKPKAQQKPVLYKQGKKLRNLDLAFREGNYQKAKALREQTILKPNVTMHEQILHGKTLLEAVSNIHVDINMKEVRKRGFGLFYNVHVRIEKPNGEIIRIPVHGTFRDMEFKGTNYIPIDGKRERFGRDEVQILANLHSQMSKSIRYALKNGGGYTFTSLVTLDAIQRREKRNLEKAEAVNDVQKADKIVRSLRGLYFGAGGRKRNFVNEETKLKELTKGYKVTLFVKFEMMYD